MGFFDLNIPYHESDRHVIDKRSFRDKRLDLTLKSMELGYTGVAYNRTIKGVMSDSQRCTTTLFPISKITPSSFSWFLNSVKFHRQLLNVPVTAPFRQYTRLTVVVDTLSQVAALSAGNPVLRSYDLVAVRPMNQNTFDQACQMAEVDMIAIEFSDRLPFRLKQPMVKAAIKRGVIFEITYSGLIIDPQSRQQMMSNGKLLVDWTKGKNLIFSSAAPTVTELRGPQDIANLVCLLGLTMERARAAISKNCRTLLTGALRKRQFYKGAIKIEEIPSGKQVDPDQYPFDNWLKWDPISSGEGDLLLDEMEKSFVEANNLVAKTFKPINFTSAMNGLPVHGFQVKDILSLNKDDLEPLLVNDLEPAAMDVDETDVCEKNAEQCVSPLPEESDILGDQASNITIVNTLIPATREGEAYVDSVEIGHQASRFENTDCEPWQTDNKSNHKQPVSVSDEKLVDHLLASNFVPSTTQFEGIQSHIVLPDKKPGIINDDHTSVELSCPLDRSNSSAAKLEESCVDIRCNLDLYTLQSSVMDRVAENADTENSKEPHQASESAVMPEQYSLSAVQSNPFFVENRSDLDVCANEVGAFDQTLDKNDSERNDGLSLPPFDGSKQDSYVIKEKCQVTTDRFIALDDALSTEEFSSPAANLNAPVSDDLIDDRKQNDSVIGYQGLSKSQAGKGKRKRNSPLLFPFKRFLNRTHFKRKARK